jgi:DNA-binding CsgD family transcriptional regulator
MAIYSKSGLLEKYKALVNGRTLDKGINNYKDDLLNRQSLESMILLNVQFVYILDLSDLSLPFVSDGIYDILGYKKSEVGFDDIIYNLIHPDERDFVCNKSLKALEWAFSNNSIKPYEKTLSINYRLRKKDGSYLSVLRQTSIHSVDYTGQIIHCLSIVSALSPTGTNSDLTKYVSSESLFSRPSLCFSARQLEILRLLSDGRTSKEIASKLFLSTFTVENHRKNMLKKSNLKKTSELLEKAKEYGLI